MIWLNVAALFALAGFVFWLVSRTSGPEQQLQGVCRGGSAKASRLINYELRRTPGTSRREAAV